MRIGVVRVSRFFLLVFIIISVSCDSPQCSDGPHSHATVDTETNRIVDNSVFDYGDYLRWERKHQGLAAQRSPSLSFNSDGKFKIAVFTDLHYGEGENEIWGPIQDDNSTKAMKTYLEYERPDLIVFNGDQITGNNILYNATTYWNKLLQPAIQYQTPWVMLFGNHDDLSAGPGETRADLMAFDMTYELSHSQAGPENIHGVSNYYVPIYAFNDTKTPQTILYLLDSGGGQEQPSQIFPDQIQWYQNTSTQLQKRYNKIIPALAFFHIPLPESMKAWNEVECSGYKNESVVCQDVDTGTFQAFLEQGDVRATVSGHNHKNDYCCPYQGIDICYARHSGYGGYGPHAPWVQGTRIINLSIANGAWDMSSYIRLEDGTILDNPPTHQPCSGSSFDCQQDFCGTDI